MASTGRNGIDKHLGSRKRRIVSNEKQIYIKQRTA